MLVALGVLLLGIAAAGIVLHLTGNRRATPPPETTVTQPAPPPRPQPTVTQPPAPLPSSGLIRDVRVSTTPFSATITWRTSRPARSTLSYGLGGGGPTLWIPVGGAGRRHEATLSGLTFATPYRAWLAAESGPRHSSLAVDLTTEPLPSAISATTAGDALQLDAQPFFPLMVWAQCPHGYPDSLGAGITVFVFNPCGGIATQLDALQGQALSVGGADEPAASGIGLIGWFFPDEADAHGLTGDTMVAPAGGAPPGQVSFLTLSNHFYSGAARLPQGRSMYPSLVQRAEVVGFDLYPLQAWCQRNRLADVFAAQRELTTLAAGRPTYQWIESSTWDCSNLPVTPATVRAESWLAVAGGAHGLGFFPAQWPSDVGQAIALVAREVRGLAPALLAPTLPVTVQTGAGRVFASARAFGGATYVIAVNATERPVRATFEAAGLAGRSLLVLDENRTLTPSGDVVSDTFAPLAAHVYIAPPG